VTINLPGQQRGRGKLAGYIALLTLGFVVLAVDAPGAAFMVVVLAVLVLDVALVVGVSRRRSPAIGAYCVLAALAAGACQAIWLYAVIAWPALPDFDDGFGWLGCGLAVALLVAIGLLARRESRPFGWAVLLGSAQGCVAMLLVILAALSAFYAGD
jgi:hypothetical protein